MDMAIAAVPEQSELPKLKADGFSVLTDTCGAAIAVGRGGTSEAELAMVRNSISLVANPPLLPSHRDSHPSRKNSLPTQIKSVLAFQTLSVTRPC
ncbi:MULTISPECIES: hypothetical protein [Rhizobium]|uniref:hypothetical protein n=1 Tax=Rhizobium TaxID=379 RepID=UPI001FE87833|nr:MULTISPECIES: hypothetical protein [Rhizobium]